MVVEDSPSPEEIALPRQKMARRAATAAKSNITASIAAGRRGGDGGVGGIGGRASGPTTAPRQSAAKPSVTPKPSAAAKKPAPETVDGGGAKAVAEETAARRERGRPRADPSKLVLCGRCGKMVEEANLAAHQETPTCKTNAGKRKRQREKEREAAERERERQEREERARQEREVRERQNLQGGAPRSPRSATLYLSASPLSFAHHPRHPLVHRQSGWTWQRE